jgi:hypothetical protein
MLGLFTKKTTTVVEQKPIARQYSLISDGTDEELISVLNDVFSENRPVISTLLLVALEEFPARYAIFQRTMLKSKQYPASMDGMIAFANDMHSKQQGDDLDSEITSRKWYFLYIAGLLTIAHERAEKNPALWRPIACIWLQLLDAAKNLRTTLHSTSIWNPDEIFFFNISEENDEDIVTFVAGALLPAKLRFHPLLLEWKYLNLQNYRPE